MSGGREETRLYVLKTIIITTQLCMTHAQAIVFMITIFYPYGYIHIARIILNSAAGHLAPLRWHKGIVDAGEDLLQVRGHDDQTLDALLQLHQ